MSLTEDSNNHFRYVVMAARRARQLQNGSQPLVDSASSKACRVAQDEIAAGKVTAGTQYRESMQLRPAIQQDPEEN